jgi:hypothetical protein
MHPLKQSLALSFTWRTSHELVAKKGSAKSFTVSSHDVDEVKVFFDLLRCPYLNWVELN